MFAWIRNFFGKKETPVRRTTPPVVMFGATPTARSKPEARQRPKPRAPGPRLSEDPSQFGTCKHCNATLSRNLLHSCPVTNVQYDPSRQDDFLLSMVIGQATGNPILGGMVGGNMMGGLIGSELHYINESHKHQEPSSPIYESPAQEHHNPSYESHHDHSSFNNDTPSTPDYGSSDSYSAPDTSSFDCGSSDSGGSCGGD